VVGVEGDDDAVIFFLRGGCWSSLPQYLITAMLVGERPVAMNTHCPSGVIGSLGFARSGRPAETTRRSGGGRPRGNGGISKMEFVSFTLLHARPLFPWFMLFVIIYSQQQPNL
jgi:hypothetical protein